MQPITMNQVQSAQSFGHRHHRHNRGMENSYKQTLAFATMPDQDLYKIAKIDASQDDRRKASVLAPLLIGIPVIDTFVSAAAAGSGVEIKEAVIKNGQLNPKSLKLVERVGKTSTKLAKLASKTAGWSAVLAGAVAYNVALNKVEKVSPTVRSFRENHPVLDLLLNLTGFGLLLTGANKLMEKAPDFFAKHFPGATKDMATNSKKLASKINKSTINKKLILPTGNKITELAKRHPRLAIFTLRAAALAVPVLLIGGVFKIVTDNIERKAKIRDTYKRLATGREICRNKLEQLSMGQIVEPVAKKANAEAKEAGAEFNEVA